MELEILLHEECFVRKQKVLMDGEHNNKASPRKSQGGGVYDKTSP